MRLRILAAREATEGAIIVLFLPLAVRLLLGIHQDAADEPAAGDFRDARQRGHHQRQTRDPTVVRQCAADPGNLRTPFSRRLGNSRCNLVAFNVSVFFCFKTNPFFGPLPPRVSAEHFGTDSNFKNAKKFSISCSQFSEEKCEDEESPWR